VDEDERWTRVVVQVQPEHLELVADVLWAFGPAAIEEQAQPSSVPSSSVQSSSVRLSAGFADPDAAREAAAALRERGWGPSEIISVRDHGLDAWRAWARPVAAGPFLVTPSWLATEGASDDTGGTGSGLTPLLIDPGHTFGSGSHATTRLVLARLAALVRPGDRVLDVGCGSGILAVGAALAGAGTVHAIDVDPGAPAATDANATANGVADRVQASTAALGEVAARAGGTGRYDLVLANLLAPVVIELAGDLAAVMARGGHLVVSGLLVDRWEPAVTAVVAAADPPGSIAVTHLDEDDGWVAVTLARPT
jgi:ribosomal protein L11 methyltransferase